MQKSVIMWIGTSISVKPATKIFNFHTTLSEYMVLGLITLFNSHEKIKSRTMRLLSNQILLFVKLLFQKTFKSS